MIKFMPAHFDNANDRDEDLPVHKFPNYSPLSLS